MRVLENLEPVKVYQYFEEICNIPHGSCNLDAISAYLAKFAEDRGLFCIRDKSNNIIIVKNATKGYEEVEPIMLQGHMDMVAVKKADYDIDLKRDPLRLKVDGDFIYAEGTSLGGDDGIAVAYMLAILDSDNIEHPRIEAVITTDEEIGMEGATAIDLSMLKARRMLNIDSEEEGILLTSCAGGSRADCVVPIDREEKEGTFYKLTIGGLAGGHSGTEIDKERGNAIKLMGRTLSQLMEKIPVQIEQLNGGEKDNAIPRESIAVVYIPDKMEEEYETRFVQIEAEIKDEYATKEKQLSIKTEKMKKMKGMVLTKESTEKAADFLVVLQNGIMAMSADIPGLVETSLNVGVLELNEEYFVTKSAIRSSIESAKADLKKQIATAAKLAGGTTSYYGEYPGWKFNPDSKLRAMMIEIYQKMFGKEPKIEALHAGLECGIMISKIPGLDCISFGPNILDIHTTEEKLSISSANRMWDYLLEILKQK